MESRATELTCSIDEIELTLKDAEKYSKNKDQVAQAYSEAIRGVTILKRL